jgi:hypothetical protein
MRDSERDSEHDSEQRERPSLSEGWDTLKDELILQYPVNFTELCKQRVAGRQPNNSLTNTESRNSHGKREKLHS